MRSVIFSCILLLALGSVNADELVLEDYQGGGEFQVADWANSFADPEGNRNSAIQSDQRAVVTWATKWSGLPSNGEAIDASTYTTFQADVMVPKDQPAQEGTNFYFQLLNEGDVGYSYWEAYVPQTLVPSDGKWYRIEFPIKSMATGHGDGGEKPTDFKTINGTVCGMTFDEDGSKFKLKKALFDNLTLTTNVVKKATASPSPKSVSTAEKR
ncbi:MAG: hypothetical protein HKN47_07140 [Pirellulaceae bacterium]|nr:hypothetical protein [Pirellulaceae bacterium]